MKLLCLLSTGLDSPVAALLMLQQGHDVEFVHMKVGNSHLSAQKIVDFLGKKFRKKLKIHILDHEKNLQKITKKLRDDDLRSTCILCKRTMIREASRIASEIGADFLLTGDNLAQVASQTIPNLIVENDASAFPMIRPLIGLNKDDIIEISRREKLYDLAVLGKNPCEFVPKKPVTKSNVEQISKLEKKVFG